MIYYVIDWEEKEIAGYSSKAAAEKFIQSIYDEFKKPGGAVGMEDFTVIKGEELKFELPKSVKIIEEEEKKK